MAYIEPNPGITWPTIVIFGDSLTEGANDATGQGWADRLKADWKIPRPAPHSTPNVYALGVDGDGVNNILQRFDVETAARNPRGIIFAIGINDLSWSDGRTPMSAETFEKKYDELLTAAQRYTHNIICISLMRVNESNPYHGLKNDDIRARNQIISHVATEHAAAYLDIYDLLPNSELDDGLHPNTAGYTHLYTHMKATLEQMGWNKL